MSMLPKNFSSSATGLPRTLEVRVMADLSGLPESPTLSQLCLRHTQLSSLLPTLWQQHLPSTFCSKLDRVEDEPQETRTFQRSPFSMTKTRRQY